MKRGTGISASVLFTLTLIFSLSFILMASRFSWAEHPMEQPSGHPTGEVKKPLTKKEMSAAIQSYIKSESSQHGGYYEIYDDLQGKKLYLKLKKIHDDRLSHVGNDVYFFCVDLADKDGKIYDLDFFMKRDRDGDLNVTEVTIHKQEGKERYTWYKEDGIWKKRWVVQKGAQPGTRKVPSSNKSTIGEHPSPMPSH